MAATHRVPQGRVARVDLQPEMLARASRRRTEAGCANHGVVAMDGGEADRVSGRLVRRGTGRHDIEW